MTEVSNPELLMYALWELGATGKFVDIEDVILKAHSLSPSRFGWRAHDLPSDKIGDQALRDLLKSDDRHLVMVSKNRDLQLTSDGVEWVRGQLDRLREASVAGALAGSERPSQRPLIELEVTEWVRQYADGAGGDPSRREFAQVLRLTPDASPTAWTERVATLHSAAQRSRRESIIRFLSRLRREHPEWFGGRP